MTRLQITDTTRYFVKDDGLVLMKGDLAEPPAGFTEVDAAGYGVLQTQMVADMATALAASNAAMAKAAADAEAAKVAALVAAGIPEAAAKILITGALPVIPKKGKG